MSKSMKGDIDIMGVQRGAHKDGEHICPKFVFKVPGGVQEDGTPLWGWNDADGARCARCKLRDLDHIVIRDYCQEGLEEERKKAEKERQKKAMKHVPLPTATAPGTEVTPSGEVQTQQYESSTAASVRARKEMGDPLASQIGMFELEPGVPDPLAFSAYKQAEKEQMNSLNALKAQKAKAAAAEAAANPTGVDIGDAPVADEENERFKAEIEKMVREQVAKEKLDKLSAPAASALTIKEMLASLSLERYLPAFEEEGMEMSVLTQLASTEDGKAAVDEALKELGVKSIGHRLKIFAALQ